MKSKPKAKEPIKSNKNNNKRSNNKNINNKNSIQKQERELDKKLNTKNSFRKKKVQQYTNPYLNSDIDSPDDTVIVIDAIMGKGKTSAIINYINESPNNTHFIYITPYLTEVNRIKENCKEKRFIEPTNNNSTGSKTEDFIKLLGEGKNIVTTHSLFINFNEECIEIAKLNNYILIMDEVANVVNQLKITQEDLDTILQKYAMIDESTKMLIWKDEEKNYKGKFEEYKNQAELNTIYIYNNTAFLWAFPVSIFKAFSKVFILTYKFTGQLQCYYYRFFKVDYKYAHVIENLNEKEYHKRYRLEDKIYEDPQESDKNKYNQLIHICNDEKLNKIGGDPEEYFKKKNKKIIGSLSKTWYNDNKEKQTIQILKNNTYNYFFNKVEGNQSDNNMWTTFNDYKGMIKGKGYTKGFVPCNARATNDYVNKATLAYLINRYITPTIKNFFIENEIEIDEDEFALSEMLQWIFRSQIREEKEINIYIPSLRMRILLEEWLKDH